MSWLVRKVIWLWHNRLLVTLYLFLGSLIWHFATITYLHGLAEGINTKDQADELKVLNILDWLSYRETLMAKDTIQSLNQRDTVGILSNKKFLRICGTASFAFVNLATESGLKARRLILIWPDNQAKHVVAEVWLQGKWAVVDPAFTILLRSGKGDLVTKEELRDPRILHEATKDIVNYQAHFTYEQPTHFRFESVPFLGNKIRLILNFVDPLWEDHHNKIISLSNTNSSIFVLVTFLMILLSIPNGKRVRIQIPVW